MNNQYLLYSSLLSLCFLIFAKIPPIMDAAFTNCSGILAVNSCPTFLGHILSTILFFICTTLIFYFLNSIYILKFAIPLTLLFFFLSNKEIFQTLEVIFGGMSNSIGCPTTNGLFINLVGYFALSYYLLKKIEQ